MLTFDVATSSCGGTVHVTYVIFSGATTTGGQPMRFSGIAAGPKPGATYFAGASLDDGIEQPLLHNILGGCVLGMPLDAHNPPCCVEFDRLDQSVFCHGDHPQAWRDDLE